jgi:hypothetical protein
VESDLSELGRRVSEGQLEDLQRLLRFEDHDKLIFIEFWSLLERSLTDASRSSDGVCDDLQCLRLLRDQTLQELHRSSDSVAPQISHAKLMIILRDVRDRAVRKETWDEAIKSSAVSGVRMHSLTAISSAITAMLDEYLQASPSEMNSPTNSIPPPKVVEMTPRSIKARQAELQKEVDDLKSRLTKAECLGARLAEEKQSLEREKVSERGIHIQELTEKTNELNSAKLELEKLESERARLEEQNSRLRSRVTELEIPLDFPSASATTVPTLEEWRLALHQITRLQAALGEDKHVLLSQIQTLEVQKNDAEAELTRLKLMSKTSPSIAPSVISANRQLFQNTVSVHGTETCSTRRSSIAEQFVDLVPANRKVLHVDGYTKPKGAYVRKRSSTNNKNTADRCVQQ